MLNYLTTQWLYFTQWSSTDKIALLSLVITLTYAAITFYQLSTMRKQLVEMKASREYQAQPFPWVSIVQAKLWTPIHEKDGSYDNTLRVRVKIKNIGENSAVDIDVISVLSGMECIKEKSRSLSYKIPVLQANDEEELTINTYGVSTVKFITALRQTMIALHQTRPHPELTIKVLYKNLTGGTFLTENSFYLIPKTEHDAITLSDWEEKILSGEIESLPKSTVNLELILKTGSTKAHPISRVNYEEQTKQLEYNIDIYGYEDM